MTSLPPLIDFNCSTRSQSKILTLTAADCISLGIVYGSSTLSLVFPNDGFPLELVIGNESLAAREGDFLEGKWWSI